VQFVGEPGSLIKCNIVTPCPVQLWAVLLSPGGENILHERIYSLLEAKLSIGYTLELLFLL